MDNEEPIVDEVLENDVRLEDLELNKSKNKTRLFFKLVIIVSLILVIATILIWKISTDVKNEKYKSEIIDLIKYEKGLLTAIEHDFIQFIDKSDQHDGITFTVDSLIVDESKMIVFYTISGLEKYNYIKINEVDLLNPDGEEFRTVISSEHFLGEVEDVESNKIDFLFNEDTLGDEFILNVGILVGENADEEEKLPYTWSVPVQVDKTLFQDKKQIYEINQTVDIQGQLITFEEIVIHPTRSELSVYFDEDNSKKIFGFDELYVVDQDGNEWGTQGSTQLSEYAELIYFDSNYFNKSEELFIVSSSIRALDKDKLELQVDLEEEKLIKAPDENITLEYINEKEEELELGFYIKYDGPNEMRFDEIKHEYFDDTTTYSFKQSMSSYITEDNLKETVLYIPKKEYTNPLTFSFWDYPARIKKDIRVKIK